MTIDSLPVVTYVDSAGEAIPIGLDDQTGIVVNSVVNTRVPNAKIKYQVDSVIDGTFSEDYSFIDIVNGAAYAEVPKKESAMNAWAISYKLAGKQYVDTLFARSANEDTACCTIRSLGQASYSGDNVTRVDYESMTPGLIVHLEY